VGGKRRLTQRGVQRMRDKEASTGLDKDDEATRWLEEHNPKPPPTPKSAKKSATLHRFRQRKAP